MRRFFTVLTVAFAALALFSSCEIGLGEAVDMEAPVITISSPDFMSSVQQNFYVRGTATDNKEVKKLVVEFSSRTYEYSDGSWTLNGGPYADAGFSGENWFVWVSLDAGVSSEYVIKASAYDEMQNTSNNSVAYRTVVYDSEPPVVTLIQPKTYADFDAAKNALDGQVTHETFSTLANYLNGDITVQGYQDEKYNLGSLQLRLTDSTGGTIYYESEKITDTESLRNFTFQIPESDLKNLSADKTAKNYMQIIITSLDEAGNEETRSHGVFCYWPESDLPWIELPDATIYYPNYQFQGQCYDDDGIGTISVLVKDDSGAVVASTAEDFSSQEDDILFYTFTVRLPSDSGTFTICANMTDKNGTSATQKTQKITIQDVTIPMIDALILPSQSEPLFGDASGNITFQVRVSDDSGVDCVEMVWVKEAADELAYLNPASDAWDSASYKWQMTRVSQTFNETTERNEFIYKKTLNLFTDLGVDGSSIYLDAKKFVFRVTDNSASPNKTSKSFGFVGDTTAPELSFSTLSVKNSETSATTDYPISTLTTLSAFANSGDMVKISGTWSDNSTDVWKNSSRIGDVTLKWNTTEFTVTKTSLTTWESGWIVHPDGTSAVLTANQKDFGGNEQTSQKAFSIASENPYLECITASTADGSYTTGKEIVVQMKFNKAVKWAGTAPSLTMSTGSTATVTTATGTLSKSITFSYTVTAGQNDDDLNVTKINVGGTTFTDSMGARATVYSVSELNAAGKNLADFRDIKICTTAPSVSSIAYDGSSKLTVTFSASVVKNSGNITITQTNIDRVPVVLLESEYTELCSANAAFKNYYENGTNGCDSSGTADFTSKYILKYDYDSTDSTLVGMYKAANAHVVTVSVSSSAVSISGTKMTVSLAGSYALPVKGGSYSVAVPAEIVTDTVGNKNTAGTKTVWQSGVEAPVIRVNKSSATFDASALTATQPMTSSVKIDCETPASTIKYAVNSTTFKITDSANQLVLYNGSSKASTPSSAGNLPGFKTPSTAYSTFTVGTSDWTRGEKHAISANASATVNGKAVTSDTAYEMAYKSVFVFYDNGGKGTLGTNGRVWLRGGDNETGSNATVGFPLSWDTGDYSGIALMTQDGNFWYYVSWGISTKAYVGLLTGGADSQSGTKGPVQWYWSSNAWVPFHAYYPLYPGESRVVCVNKDEQYATSDNNNGNCSYSYSPLWGVERGGFSWNTSPDGSR